MIDAYIFTIKCVKKYIFGIKKYLFLGVPQAPHYRLYAFHHENL